MRPGRGRAPAGLAGGPTDHDIAMYDRKRLKKPVQVLAEPRGIR
jgi:hypothetical protein